MAKRKRLTPAQPDHFSAQTVKPRGMPAALGAAPIAQVAGEASARAALDELSGVIEAARSEGRMLELLPLEQIDDAYLVRDRLVQDSDEMAALMDSLRTRGQQTPIEVVALPDPRGVCTHGLISGWRRLTALRQLHAETEDDRFAAVRAVVISPHTAQDAYVAMVEENEIRVNLSLYERARIALRAVHEGVYSTSRQALQGLFGSTTRSKRSKIGSFITLVEALDDILLFPDAISEKLGLALVKAIQNDPDFAKKLRNSLESTPRGAAAEELRCLASALQASPRPEVQGKKGSGAPTATPASLVSPGPTAGLSVQFDEAGRRITLSGSEVDRNLYQELQRWLSARGKGQH